MKKHIIAFAALLGASCLVSAAAPPINFASDVAPLDWPSFNGPTQTDSVTFQGIVIDGFTYSSPTSYRQDEGFLWLRKNTKDNGLGYCSVGESCGVIGTTGSGDFNELSNNQKEEIIRLTLPSGKVWSDIWISSLDEGGTDGNETGTFYWSNSDKPNLNNTTSFINFSHDGVFGNGSSTVEGSIFNYLKGMNPGFVTAKYLFFRAGEWSGITNVNGSNNDYLVYGVGVGIPIPEPDTYAMLVAGLGLLGFIARRRKHQAA